MFKSLREMKHHLSEIEDAVSKQSQVMFQLNWDQQQLRRENSDYKTWNKKLRAKNSALRKERRRLRTLLDQHGIAQGSSIFHEKTVA